jgi:hypothetical protein
MQRYAATINKPHGRRLIRGSAQFIGSGFQLLLSGEHCCISQRCDSQLRHKARHKHDCNAPQRVLSLAWVDPSACVSVAARRAAGRSEQVRGGRVGCTVTLAQKWVSLGPLRAYWANPDVLSGHPASLLCDMRYPVTETHAAGRHAPSRLTVCGCRRGIGHEKRPRDCADRGYHCISQRGGWRRIVPA